MDKKFLIILFYYNRPNLVRFGLESILAQSYKNWEIVFIDDGSEVPGEPIVKEVVGEQINKVKFYRSDDTPEQKMERNGINGSLMGKFANQAIQESDADYVLILCDDDALYENYLENLNKWFSDNPDKNYVFSHIKKYDPQKEKPIEPMPFREHHLNKTGSVRPYYGLDMSQIAWRRKSFIDSKISFPYPFTVNIDAEIFLQMMREWGNVDFSGFIGQYKAIHDDNLSHRMGAVIGGRKKEIDIYKINTK